MADFSNSGMVCDCHIHSFSKRPAKTSGAYAPPLVDISDYAQEVAPLGIKRAVIIQASVDGTDNSRLVETLSQSVGLSSRGVAAINPETADLQALHAAGVRAIRIQDRARLGDSDLHTLPALGEVAAGLGWHIELNTEPRSFDDIAALMPKLPKEVSLVLDHIAHVDPEVPGDLQKLRRLMDTGRVWVKLSPTRVSRQIGQYDDLDALVAKIAQGYPDQCIWGSDWPHVMTKPPLPQIPPMLKLLERVLSTEQYLACTWKNPEKLYSF
nr:amidohydrolase family protein [uncultured Cohaesibacter sp.]